MSHKDMSTRMNQEKLLYELDMIELIIEKYFSFGYLIGKKQKRRYEKRKKALKCIREKIEKSI